MNERFYIHPTATVDNEDSIGFGTKIWHYSHVMSNAKVGSGCILGQNVYVDNGAVVGDRCKIQNNVSIYSQVILGDDVFCGPSCVFTNVLNPRSFIERKSEFKKTVVSRGVTIGANATIVCGVEIGEYAFIGAGAVVTENVAPYSLVVGIPASPMGWVSRCAHRLDFEKGQARCPESGEIYLLNDNGVMASK